MRARPRIAVRANDPERPYAHLAAVVAALVRSGNPVDQPFSETKSGFYCSMRLPIDFTMLRAEFDFPPNVVLDDAADVVSDEGADVCILGRNAWLPGQRRRIELTAQTALDESASGRIGLPATVTDRWSAKQRVELIAGVLILGGNDIEEIEWLRSRGGIRCELRDPIDFALIERTVELPDDIVLDPERGTVRDVRFGFVIEGPARHPPGSWSPYGPSLPLRTDLRRHSR